MNVTFTKLRYCRINTVTGQSCFTDSTKTPGLVSYFQAYRWKLQPGCFLLVIDLKRVAVHSRQM
jgi:hypothetical protein